MITKRPTRIGAASYEAANVLDSCAAVGDGHSNIIRASKEPES